MPHRGGHADKYHRFVQERLKIIDAEAQGDKEKFLELFDKYVKEPIRKNPDLMYKKGWE